MLGVEAPARGGLRARSVDYLAAAAALLFIGVLLPLALAAYKTMREGPRTNFRGEPFPSGYRYAPNQISYMCKDPSTPEGICFRAYLVTGAVCLLLSNYTFELRNVRVARWKGRRQSQDGDGGTASLLAANQAAGGLSEEKSLRKFLVARHLVLPLCMLMVALIHLPYDQPDQESTLGNSAQNAAHSIPAAAMFLGYALFEWYSLHYGIFEPPLPECERLVRLSFARASLACFAAFGVFYNMVVQAEPLGLCCEDVWRVPSLEDAAAAKSNGHLGSMVADYAHNETGVKLLFDTASGPVRLFKLAALGLEVLDFVCLGGSLLTIWLFAKH
mmetsp:Transcript_88203/g.274136  ORF Transcript_88203/g.274136 Transcript_88203/m.274136 type:complete len:330 (-) Transcript_88203:101-1090(-)|eukprot:CAMPEP_0204586490 /NCGR_PEP_ID=MMETSP0661-20131031/47520_1 /ASSEMBLY_ACC=CAM_ASM_000606 /TAXON_ID=109239 /ORGANISM="Alexandrium margalefi, Strain AMGDE01CS-322" /LENGTH=329 /DNA_ID=CAMNT_0051596135 /DNA_START=86 /DNA_END=1075 /DNA_ORIENTATION=-